MTTSCPDCGEMTSGHRCFKREGEAYAHRPFAVEVIYADGTSIVQTFRYASEIEAMQSMYSAAWSTGKGIQLVHIL